MSLDEVIVIDNTSWVYMHVYRVNDICQQCFLLSIGKLNCSMTMKNLYELLKSTLIDCGGMDNMDISKKIGVCWSGWSFSFARSKRRPLQKDPE